MYNQTTNFFGRDPIQWWIGQVTDPEKGKWDDSLRKESKQINGEQVYILDVEFVLLDIMVMIQMNYLMTDLPLAHVLLPPNTTTGWLWKRQCNIRVEKLLLDFSWMVRMLNNLLYLELYLNKLSSKMD